MTENDLRNRTTLIEAMPKGGVVAEVGVGAGYFSDVILTRARPECLFLVDCWEHQDPAVYGHDPANVPDAAQLQMYARVARKYSQHLNVVVLRGHSIPIATTFADGELDWLYLDGNHLQVRQDIEAWWPKVKSGGWFAGHDYTVAGDYITVKDDLDALVAERGLKLFVTRGDDDIYERNYPSWAFRRP